MSSALQSDSGGSSTDEETLFAQFRALRKMEKKRDKTAKSSAKRPRGKRPKADETSGPARSDSLGYAALLGEAHSRDPPKERSRLSIRNTKAVESRDKGIVRGRSRLPKPLHSTEAESVEQEATPPACARIPLSCLPSPPPDPPAAQEPTPGSPVPIPPPATLLSKRSHDPPPLPNKPALQAYDTCPTLYKKRPGKRGGRKKVSVNGKEEIARTKIEQLIHRVDKHKDVCKNGHLFGEKNGCYFNLYSYSKMNKQKCKRIEQPPGFQIGHGNQPIHKLIGLRGDYDFMCDILSSCRRAVIKFRPKQAMLKPGKALNWGHYSLSDRKDIHNWMYACYPFLYHFCDESGYDSWVIHSLCAAYLSSNRSYTQQGNKSKASTYLKRNESGPANRQIKNRSDEDNNKDDSNGSHVKPADLPAEYDNDYAHNASMYTSGLTSTSSLTHNLRGVKRDCLAPAKRACTDNYDGHRPQKKAKLSPVKRSPSPPHLPPNSSTRNNQRADKIVAMELACDQALGPSRNKAINKPVATSKARGDGKGKGQGKACKSAPATSKVKTHKEDGGSEEDCSSNDDNDDEASIQTETKAINKKSTKSTTSTKAEPSAKNNLKTTDSRSKRRMTLPPSSDEDEYNDVEQEPKPKPRQRQPARRLKPKILQMEAEGKEDTLADCQESPLPYARDGDETNDDYVITPLPPSLVPTLTDGTQGDKHGTSRVDGELDHCASEAPKASSSKPGFQPVTLANNLLANGKV
ncbi:hypothetical protein BN14_08591 [Rhizoctonia solani AG-1 IB]|uniref:Uncharacterized protein n=1 Tax=Thanatephorus cucumeris (strain AG1-IB / isolate 7/3/14) TaxID=1108050 RepID=M5C5X7_THACB|nr:hypothetical protein BN14_08591 [Rhizoctonia solani AG-1 IB]